VPITAAYQYTSNQVAFAIDAYFGPDGNVDAALQKGSNHEAHLAPLLERLQRADESLRPMDLARVFNTGSRSTLTRTMHRLLMDVRSTMFSLLKEALLCTLNAPAAVAIVLRFLAPLCSASGRLTVPQLDGVSCAPLPPGRQAPRRCLAHDAPSRAVPGGADPHRSRLRGALDHQAGGRAHHSAGARAEGGALEHAASRSE
jgi:hypothetical protein